VLTGMVQYIFGDPIQDMLSGYRVMSRRFVKSFPTIAEGFGIETEMTVHALQLRMPIAEMPSPACSFRIISIVRDLRRFSTSATRTRCAARTRDVESVHA